MSFTSAQEAHMVFLVIMGQMMTDFYVYKECTLPFFRFPCLKRYGFYLLPSHAPFHTGIGNGSGVTGQGKVSVG